MEEKKEKLAQIAQEVAACRKCPLFRTATRPVPGEGNPEAEIMFIGEAPGYWEDQKGIPFCGAAGQLLDELLGEIGIRREEVFICNILKHRPPNNRDPLPGEIKACTPFLRRQILTIKPAIIVTLGRFALNFFVPNSYITSAHGKPRPILWEGLRIVVVPMFHPAAALRKTDVKQQLREDFLRLPTIIAEVKKQEEETDKKVPQQGSLF